MIKIMWILTIAAMLCFVSCENDVLDYEQNSDLVLDSRSEPCFDYELISKTNEGCCIYEICTEFAISADQEVGIHSSNIHSTVTELLLEDSGIRCWNVEFCDFTLVTLIIGNDQICDLDFYCDSTPVPCPLKATYARQGDWKCYPQWADCCIYDIEVCEAPPLGCFWETRTGPRGSASLPLATARICPDEPLELYLVCNEESTFVCELELECDPIHHEVQHCPLEVNYFSPVDPLLHPGLRDCCIYDIKLTGSPPEGCQWDVITGPRGSVSLGKGKAVICPDEPLDLEVTCEDCAPTIWCSFDLECS